MGDVDSKGAITLEACVSVLSFLILMLLLSGLFLMFMAQNLTSHAVLQTSESLSLDVFAAENIGTGGMGSTKEILVGIYNLFRNLFGDENSENTYFATNEKWYEDSKEDNTEGSNGSGLSSGDGGELTEDDGKGDLQKVIKKRFIGYLSGGDESKADELLRRLLIVDGLNGIDFSESYIEKDTLYIVLKYELEYTFNIWGLKPVSVRQTTCSKLWK